MRGGPDFDELIGGDMPEEERERLRHAHELLVQAGPPPELAPELEAVPWPEEALMPLGLTRRSTRKRSPLLLAAAVATAGLLGFVVGQAGNSSSTNIDAQRVVKLRGTDLDSDAAATWKPQAHGRRPSSRRRKRLGRDSSRCDERGVRDRHLGGEELLDGVGVAANLPLCGIGSPEGDEVHQRPRVDRPEELGIGTDRHDGACELARDTCLDEPLVRLERVLVHLTQLVTRALRKLLFDGLEGVGAWLSDLRANILGLRDVEVLGRLRIAHRKLVE